jgi:hypothetical protein
MAIDHVETGHGPATLLSLVDHQSHLKIQREPVFVCPVSILAWGAIDVERILFLVVGKVTWVARYASQDSHC